MSLFAFAYFACLCFDYLGLCVSLVVCVVLVGDFAVFDNCYYVAICLLVVLQVFDLGFEFVFVWFVCF